MESIDPGLPLWLKVLLEIAAALTALGVIGKFTMWARRQAKRISHAINVVMGLDERLEVVEIRTMQLTPNHGTHLVDKVDDLVGRMTGLEDRQARQHKSNADTNRRRHAQNQAKDAALATEIAGLRHSIAPLLEAQDPQPRKADQDDQSR